MLGGETGAFVDHVNIQMPASQGQKDAAEAGKVDVGASDSLFAGAWAGAAAVNWFTKSGKGTGTGTGTGTGIGTNTGTDAGTVTKTGTETSSGGGTTVSIGGAAGVSVTDRGVSSVISHSDITGAKSITNKAEKSGAEIATGLGLSVAKGSSSGGTNVAVSAAVSYNEADSDIHALMIGNQVNAETGNVKAETGNTDDTIVTNTAYNRDLQITGGIAVSATSGGKTGVGVGGTVVISDLDNDLQSGIIGGSYNRIRDMVVDADVATMQINAAAAAAVSTDTRSFGFTGAVSYNKINNNNSAYIDGAEITASGNVNVKAGDTEKGSSDYADYVENRGLDTTGKTDAEGDGIADKGATFVIADKKSDDETNETGSFTGMREDGGSTIVNVAASASVSNGTAAGSAAVNISDVDNTMHAGITGAKITAGSVTGQADTNTRIVSVAAGIGVSGGKFGGAGSVSWDTLSNNNTVLIDSSTITAGSVTGNALNKAQIVNVAGQVSASSKVGAGLALAYNKMDNTTGVYVQGGSLASGNIALAAGNASEITAITAGVSGAGTAAVNGTVAINRGTNSTEAVLGNDEQTVVISDAKDISVKASDESKNNTVAGGITGAGTAAVGGGAAYSDIGGSSGDADSAAQQVRAEINHAEITTEGIGTISTEAKDTSKLLTIAAGVGASGTVAVQGASATALINKNVSASMTGTSIDGEESEESGTQASKVIVSAESDSDITTSADVIGASGSVALGAGVAVNRIIQQTNASVNGGAMRIGNLDIHADGTPSIRNIGIGIAASTTAGITGSVAVNMIQNDVTAHIGQAADITADGSVGVIASSDEQIENYAGSASVSGTGAGVGVSVSVNQIKGITEATVGGENEGPTKVTALGNGEGIASDTVIEDSEIHDTLISDDTVQMGSHITRKNETRKGLVVDASSTRDLKSFLINVGIAGEGAAVAGTVNVNQIQGATSAGILHTAVNGGAAGISPAGNVYVNAGDYTNSSGFVGTAGINGIGAGVGLGSDTNSVRREVSAVIDDSTVKADTLEIDADSKQGISSFTVGGSMSGIGAGVAGVVTVTELGSETRAALTDTDAAAGNISVAASHTGIVHAGNVSAGAVGIGAGAGLSIGVLQDNSVTETTVGSVDETDPSKIDASGNVTIAAKNTTKTSPTISATGVAAVGTGIAGATSVNNLNSKVKTNISKAAVTAGGDISGSAKNTFDVDAYIGSQAGGGAGVGVGINVTVNTINSTVQTNVAGSTLEAKENVNLTAEEERDITQLDTNIVVEDMGIAAGANIAVTTVGQEISDEDTKAKIGEVNKNGSAANGLFGGASGALETAGIDESSVKLDDQIAGTGVNKEEQITVNIADSTVDAGENIKAAATETDNIHMTLGSGAAGAAAGNAGVGILNVWRNVGVNVTGGSMKAGAIDIDTDITGTSSLEVYQGTGGALFAGNAAVGQVSTSGNSGISVDGALLTGNTLNILAADHGAVNVNVLGITVGTVAAGAIVAGAENSGNTEVTIQNSTTGEKDGSTESSVSIGTQKKNTVTAHAMGGAGGAAAAQGVVATAEDKGESSVVLGNGNRLNAGRIAVAAAASPAVKAVADSAAVSIFGTAGASVATAKADGAVNVTVADGNELIADTVDISADAATQDGKNTAEASVTGNSGSGYYTAAENLARADVNMDVKVNVGQVNYKTETTKKLVGYQDVDDGSTGERQEVYEESTKGVTALTIRGSNAAKASADAKGITIGGIFSSGNNQAITSNTSKTNVSLNSRKGETRLESLNVTASGAGDNTAKADGSGGGLVGGGLAAYVENTMKAETQVNVSGTMQVEDDVTIEARQSDTANINADALKAAVVDASATRADNTISGSTGVTLDHAAITGGGDFSVSANNTVTMGNTETYAVEGSGYGGVNVQGAVFNNTINKKTDIAVKESTVVTDGTQTYEAKTAGNLTIGGYIKAAGAGAFTWVDIDNTVTADDEITVDGDSSLKTKKANQDIVLAAVDDVKMTVRGVADTQGGAVGGASSDVTSTLNRTNGISVSGDLYSMNDVNLYAGKDKNGNEGKLDLEADSESYNKTALSVSNPKLNDTINQNNTVKINADSNVSSVHNINLYADAGKESIRDSSVLYTWYWSDKKENYTSSTVGDTKPDNKNSNNFVQADGTLIAGVQNKQYITIGGEGQLVFANPAIVDAVNGYKNQHAVGIDKVQIDASNGVDVEGIKKGDFDYGTSLFERYNELGKLMQDYAEGIGDKGEGATAAYAGYKAERERIMDQLKAMGLVETLTDVNGKTYEAAVEGMTVDYIELPDIVASGGNINIQTDSLGGSGTLKAQGAPEVVVNNNTNLYLKINDITVGESGGEINFNNNALTSDNYKEKISGLNADKDKKGEFKEVSTDAESGQGGKIVINGNYGGGTVYAKVTVEGKEQEIQTTPRADIEINGLINSQNGTVEISSAANNIVIQGESASESAGVKGQTVKLSASKGSVSQGFQEGIVSIGGNVQDQYESQYEAAKNQYDNKYGYEHDTVHDDSYTGQKVESEGNMIAGENIYINAADINVNGYIQSGYADYVVNIDKAAQAQINQIQKNWSNLGGEGLSDTEVTTGTAYRIVEGKDVYDSTTGSYYRQLDVYYNPSTGQIVVPDVDANGGQVYLTGRISSTGSGKINVLDGAYDISVTNNTDTDLQLGKLISNNVSGLISIADTGTKTLTEFTRNQTVTKDMTKIDSETGDYQITGTSGASGVYNPEEGLRYNWTTGQETTTKKEYSNTIKAGLWGAVETMDKTQLDKFETEHPVNPGKETQEDKLNGEYIGKVNGIDNNKDFVVIYDNKKFQDDRVGPGDPERWSTGFLGWFKWEKYTWTVTTGTSQQYVGSVKADNPIHIGFIGNDDGNSTINIHAAGNINLTNDIRSAGSGTGSVINITSTGGAIQQTGGSVAGDSIHLSAVNGIQGIDITSIGDTVNLDAVNTGTGNVGVTVNAAYGTQGNVVIGKVFAGSADRQTGDVSLTASGTITQKGSDISISGNRIDLTSMDGAIGTAEQAVVVNGGQSVADGTDSLSASVNAHSKGNIYLTQKTGDMRIGRIYSDSGDIAVTVSDGSLIDALPTGETIDRGDTEALIQKWKDLGLIEGEGDYTEQQEEDIAAYENSVKEEFALYLQMKDYYENQQEEAEKKGDKQNDQNYQKFVERYGSYGSAEEYLESEAAQKHIADLKQAGAGWDQDQLLYAISDSVINPSSGSMNNIVKDPNLKGNNITLTVKGDVGRNSDTIKTIDLAGLGDRTDDLKTLASADAGSVTWDAAGGKAYIYEKTPLGIQMTGTDGRLNVYADGNVYLTGRTENNENVNNVMNIESVSGGNIRLQGQNGIYNVNSDPTAAAIRGNSLLIQGGTGGVGTADQNMTIAMTGSVQATAGQGLYLNQLAENDLEIYSMSAGEDIILKAKGNIVSTDNPVSKEEQEELDAGDSTGLASGYIRSDSGSIMIEAGGSAGEQDHKLRILNVNDTAENQTITVTAGKDVYLSGVSNIIQSNAPASGSMFLKGVTANGTVNIDTNGTIQTVGTITNQGSGTTKITAEKGIHVQADIQDQGEILLSAGNNLLLDKGNVQAGTVHLQAGESIEQNSDEASLTADAVTMSSTGSQLLKSKNNVIDSVSVKGLANDSLTGNVEIHSKADDFAVQFGDRTADGSASGITVHNGGIALYHEGENAGTMTVTGSAATVKEEGSETDADIVMTGAGQLTNEGTLNSVGNVAVTAEGSIRQTGDVTAQDHASFTVTGDSGDIVLGGNVTATTGAVDAETETGNIEADGSVTAGTDIAFTSTSGSITVGNTKDAVITAGSNAAFTTGNGAITVNGAVTAKAGDVTAAAGTGAIQMIGAVDAGKNIALSSDGSIGVIGNVTAGKDMTIAGGNGDVVVTGDAKAAQDISAGTKSGAIRFDGNVTAENGNVNAESETGHVTVGKDAESIIAAGNDITLTGGSGVAASGTITANRNISVAAKGEGFVSLGGNVTATTGAVDAETETGNIEADGSVTAGTDIAFTSTSGSITVGNTKDAVITADSNAAFTTGNGAITVNGAVTATAGDVTAAAGTGVIQMTGTVNAGKNIALSGDGSIDITGNVMAENGNVNAESGSGNILVDGTVKARKDIVFITRHSLNANAISNLAEAIDEAGDIRVTGGIDAGGKIAFTTNMGDITAAESGDSFVKAGTDIIFISRNSGDITVAGNATAGNDFIADTEEGDISFSGDVTAQNNAAFATGNGAITVNGAVTATAGDVTAAAGTGAIQMTGAVGAGKNIALSGDGSIDVTGNVTAGKDMMIAGGTGDVTVTGDVTAEQDISAETKSGAVRFDGNVTAANGNVNVESDSGVILVDGTVKAHKDIAFTSGSGTITVTGSTTAGDNFTADTGNGDISLSGNVKAEKGNVKAETGAGTITVAGDVTAQSNASFKVTETSGDIHLGGSVTAVTGNINAETQSGVITVGGTGDSITKAGTDITFISGSGAITVTGSAAAGNDFTAETEDGDISLGGDVTAESGDVSADTHSGAITVDGAAAAGTDIAFTSGSGAITVTGSAAAGNDFTADTESGDISLGGDVKAEIGHVMAKTGSGNIQASGSIASGRNTELHVGKEAGSQGNITVGGKIVSGEDVIADTENGNITFTGTVEANGKNGNDGEIIGGNIKAAVAGEGTITVRNDLTAAKNIELAANRGDIFFEGTEEESRNIAVTSENGDIAFSVSGAGSIRDGNSKGDSGDRAVIRAEKGNVTIANEGTDEDGIVANGEGSDIDLYEVYAKNSAKFSTAEGDLHLVNVSGNLVAVVVKKDGYHMEAENLEAASAIQIAGSNMDLDHITQREDGDGFLAITPDGTAPDEAIDDLTIGDIKTTYGVRFDHLWARTSAIHVSSGALHLDKLYIEDKGTFSTGAMSTDVFGSAPVFDDSKNSVYWIDTAQNRPGNNLADWQSEGSGAQWMYLHFDADSPTQMSNGNLLHLNKDYYVYSQRHSMADWMNIFGNDDFYTFYDRYHVPALSYPGRYGLIEGSGQNAENADSSEIIIE